jgi:FkbM family methyltransferase
MFLHQGIWLPDGEKHFPKWMTENGEVVDGRGTYQIRKWRACLPWIKQWRRAVDVGAHVGFWTIQMAPRFVKVEAFEPVQAMRECFSQNVGARINVNLYAEALGDFSGSVLMAYDPADSGGTHVARRSDGRAGSVPIAPLDSFGWADVDFLKIDCEGYEVNVLKGAVETLRRCKPCVIVEQKPHKLGPNFGIEGTPACDLLREEGAFMRTAIGGDYIFAWDE